MKRVVILLLAALITLPVGSPLVHAEDRTIDVSSDDARMNAAIAKARASLPDFWKAWESPPNGTEGYSLKVKITDVFGSEHFWTDTIERADGHIYAIIANEPQTVKSIAAGQRIEVPEADISDWMYWRDGKIVGNETLRVLLQYMSKEEADYWRALLD
jgi:uncharacterized protein YegJ (DUF2314 family)